MGTYTEQYQYDAVGNFLQFIHKSANPANPGWTRSYTYNEASPLESGKVSNRLTKTSVSGSQPLNEPYTHDQHGNMTSMPHLQAMTWDFKDQLNMTRRQAVNSSDTDGNRHQGERTYYVYDATGQRTRKTTESSAGVKTKERFYLGGFELYREYGSDGNVTLARETLHVMDDKKRVALVETKAVDTSIPAGSLPSTSMRYQFDNHLGTACLELDGVADVISYEEYYPYGSTSYQAGRTLAEVSVKRYRYTGKERDEETGFNYHGARYYAPWISRWTAVDPLGLADGPCLYQFVQGNPIRLVDPAGTDSQSEETCKYIAASSYPHAQDWVSTCTGTGSSGIPQPSLTGPTVHPGAHQTAPSPKPKPVPSAQASKPAASKPAMSDADSLKILKSYAEQMTTKTYPKEITHVLGGVQMIGGVAELVGAGFTTETGVGPVLLGVHGLDTLQTGARTAWTGEQQKSGVFYAGSGASFLFSNDPQLASAFGSTADMAAGVGAFAYSLKILPPPKLLLPPVIALSSEAADTSLVSQTLEQAEYLKGLGSTQPGAEIGKGNQVLAGVEYTRTGQRFFGRSTENVASNLHPAFKEYAPWRGLIEGDRAYAHFGPVGAHGEVNALNRALWTIDPTGTALTATDLGSFDMTAVWLGKGGPFMMGRCPTCWFMTPYVNFIGQ
jgi:RHS repeat-associated protein